MVTNDKLPWTLGPHVLVDVKKNKKTPSAGPPPIWDRVCIQNITAKIFVK